MLQPVFCIDASQLATHRQSHLEPQTPCDVCGKLFRNKHKLKVHEKVHTGQKDYACPQCPYLTYVRHNLKKHCLARHNYVLPPINPNRHIQKFPVNDASFTINDPLALSFIQKISKKDVSGGGANVVDRVAVQPPVTDMTAIDICNVGGMTLLSAVQIPHDFNCAQNGTNFDFYRPTS